MAFANAAVIAPSSLYGVVRISYCDPKAPLLGSHGDSGSGFCSSAFCVGSHAGKSDVVLERRRLKSVDTRIVENTQMKSTIEIPVSCYQLIGVPGRAEKDEIVKAVMGLKNAEIEEGYTMAVVASRQELLMDVRDKLLFEPEYTGNLREKIPPKSSLRIPWSWLPAALCLLQEVGESKLVLDTGRTSLQHQDAKPYTDDLVLSMALAECALAKIGFEKNKVSQGFEALARAQCLLRSKPSLAKITLLCEIEESLEELAPACTLELLSMPRTPENVDRRRGAIAALRELLRQGLDVEASCQVQDWPSFLSQAFDSLLANEIVDLLPWDNLAMMRKNKKTIESQNLRISKAKDICECLIASEGIDLKFEEAFCSFLLGQGKEAEVVEKLKLLELNSNPKHNSVLGKAIMDASAANPSLEKWLKDSVLALFPDTKDCSPALASFFNTQKKISGSRNSKGAQQTTPTICHRPLSSSGALDRRDFEEPRSYMSSSPNLGFAVKQLTPTDLQSSLLTGRTETESNLNESPVEVKRNLGTHRNGTWDSHFIHSHIFGKITYITILGCIAFATIKLLGMNLSKTVTGSHRAFTKANDNIAWTADSSAEYTVGPAYIRRSTIADRLKRILAMVKIQFLHQSDAGNQSNLHTALASSSCPTNVYRRLMPVEEAETLVRQWQTIKAEALGPSHEVNCLAQVLDESMLAQWQALADAAKERSCHWRFVLLKLSVLRADILSDGNGEDMAEIEAVLEEAAELVDNSQQKNPNYYSTYKVKYVMKRQDDGSWKFCEGDIRTP
ncbi:plastid division protein CDP1, chloroplastic isoform X2 [Gastrolobium bilobum]|uniref:plastid division protein CDP1, chloroplastic isoform X2 n=1 Tax=Gastrolobium bilobum TaxID=150636 RepID=UPI002AB2CB6C|nr:plastid division protein CDP1, chloroplastic isoform X2 [Gastrolobium bilobum]